MRTRLEEKLIKLAVRLYFPGKWLDPKVGHCLQIQKGLLHCPNITNKAKEEDLQVLRTPAPDNMNRGSDFLVFASRYGAGRMGDRYKEC